MCARNLKEHVDLNTKEDTRHVRKLIIRYIDSHRDRGGVMPMDDGNLHTEVSEYDDCNTQGYMSEHMDAVAPAPYAIGVVEWVTWEASVPHQKEKGKAA